MTKHQGDLRFVGNVVQVFTGDAWVEFGATSLYEKGRADMLDDVTKWLDDKLSQGEYLYLLGDYIQWPEIRAYDLLCDLKEAMRQQQQEDS